jgi:hypothetical protein
LLWLALKQSKSLVWKKQISALRRKLFHMDIGRSLGIMASISEEEIKRAKEHHKGYFEGLSPF